MFSFKQNPAYEIRHSLVGSGMGIRDRVDEVKDMKTVNTFSSETQACAADCDKDCCKDKTDTEKMACAADCKKACCADKKA